MEAIGNIAKAQERQKKQADKHRLEVDRRRLSLAFTKVESTIPSQLALHPNPICACAY